MDSVSNSLTRNPRPRLLHSWWASLITIAQKTYQQAERFHGPVGSITRTLASAAIPILHPMERQWLSILSFIDDQILSIEDSTMTIFPPASYLFCMVDELAHLAESFPKRFDDAINALSSLIQHLPLFEPVLKPLLSKIGSWEWNYNEETMVDIKCDEQEKKINLPKEGVEDGNAEVLPVKKLEVYEENKLSKNTEEEIKEVEETCKEIIEELEKMGVVKEEKGVEGDKGEMIEEELEEEKEVQAVASDPIVVLFDEGWGGQRSGDH